MSDKRRGGGSLTTFTRTGTTEGQPADGRTKYTLVEADFADLAVGTRWGLRLQVTPATSGTPSGWYPEDDEIVMRITD